MITQINSVINKRLYSQNPQKVPSKPLNSPTSGIVLKFKQPLHNDAVYFGAIPLSSDVKIKKSTAKALQESLANFSSEIMNIVKPYQPVIKNIGLNKIHQAFKEALNPKSEFFKESVQDLKFILEKDPALKEKNEKEAILYKSLIISFSHRIANNFYKKGETTIARAVSEATREITGAEIHPGATIGKRFFIDHPTGLVIGETAKIGNRFHGHGNVLLGSDGVNSGKDRHPIVGQNVTIWPHAKVHGGKIIGDNSVIGCDAVITENVPEKSIVVGHNILVQLDGKKTKIHLKDYWENLSGNADTPNLASK